MTTMCDAPAEVLKTDILGGEKNLICMVGLPYSGKSTVAKDLGSPVVNPDSIRVALHGRKFIGSMEPYVWAIAKTMVKSLFLAGHNTVILDATNTTNERRDEWTSREWRTSFYCIYTPQDICETRARERGDYPIIPIIAKMADQLTWPESNLYV